MLLTEKQYQRSWELLKEAQEEDLCEGKMSLEEAKWWLKLNRVERLRIMAGGTIPECRIVTEPPPDFVLLWKFELVVPDDYRHRTCLADFWKKHRGEHSSHTKEDERMMGDANFTSPTHILNPGEKFEIRLFANLRPLSSKKCLAFYAKEGAYCTGAQGAALLYSKKFSKLVERLGIVSLDNKGNLPKITGHHMVPVIKIHGPVGNPFFGGTGRSSFVFYAENYERVWWERGVILGDYFSFPYAFVLFCDPPPK
ncbi:MAG TPA: hypothetical protein VJG48_03240 [Candidatus Paceibacterota bacterium]